MKKIGFFCFVVLVNLALVGAEPVSVVGTGSGMSVLEEIAEDFMSLNPQIEVAVPPSIGSGGGILSVGSGIDCLGRVARPIKESEEKYGLQIVEIAHIPIVFFANNSCGVQSLTHDQVLGIYTGQITNWSQVGGVNQAIIVVRRESGDSSLDVLEKTMDGFSGDSISRSATTKYSNQDVVSFVEDNSGSIAFGSYSDGANANVVVFSLDQIDPDSQRYPYYGPLSLIYQNDNLPVDAKAFLDFAVSEGAHDAIERAFGIPRS